MFWRIARHRETCHRREKCSITKPPGDEERVLRVPDAGEQRFSKRDYISTIANIKTGREKRSHTEFDCNHANTVALPLLHHASRQLTFYSPLCTDNRMLLPKSPKDRNIRSEPGESVLWQDRKVICLKKDESQPNNTTFSPKDGRKNNAAAQCHFHTSLFFFLLSSQNYYGEWKKMVHMPCFCEGSGIVEILPSITRGAAIKEAKNSVLYQPDRVSRSFLAHKTATSSFSENRALKQGKRMGWPDVSMTVD